jgi:proline racemase/trans-L-3-hydroxyproline dehydratase
MNFVRMITAVDAHAAGQSERVIIGGIPRLPGQTMLEKVRCFYQNFDQLRTLLLHEPRGHAAMHGSLITEPSVEEADFGVIYLGSGGYDPVCGHGTIAICTVLVETGMVEPKEPSTEVILDTPGGIVRGIVAVQDGSAQSVTIHNVPSFLYEADVRVAVPKVGRVTVDIAYGGDLFIAILPAASVGLEIVPERRNEIIHLGLSILEATAGQVDAQHPEMPELKGLTGVMFSGPATHEQATMKNALVYSPGNIDRSPCGTGTSAKMATLYAKGELALNEEFVHESIVGSLFIGRLVSETTLGRFRAVVPTITGSAYIMGIQQFVLDPRDPFPAGFLLGEQREVYGAEF